MGDIDGAEIFCGVMVPLLHWVNCSLETVRCGSQPFRNTWAVVYM